MGRRTNRKNVSRRFGGVWRVAHAVDRRNAVLARNGRGMDQRDRDGKGDTGVRNVGEAHFDERKGVKSVEELVVVKENTQKQETPAGSQSRCRFTIPRVTRHHKS